MIISRGAERAYDKFQQSFIIKHLTQSRNRMELFNLEKSTYEKSTANIKLDMNNRLVPNRKRSTSTLYIVTLFI